MRIVVSLSMIFLFLAFVLPGQGHYPGTFPKPNDTLPEKALLRYGLARTPHGVNWASLSPTGQYFAFSRRINPLGQGEPASLVGVCESEAGRPVFQVAHDDDEPLMTYKLPSLKPVVYLGSRKGLITGYDFLTRKRILELRTSNNEPVNFLAVCPLDQTLVATGDLHLRLWNVPTGKELHCLEPRSKVSCLCFFPNGKTLLTGDNAGSVCFIDVVTGKIEKQFDLFTPKQVPGRPDPEVSISILACSPDGKYLAARASAAEVVLLSLETGKEIRRTNPNELQFVIQVLFLPNESTLLLLCYDKIRCWDAKTGRDVEHPLTKIRYSDLLTLICGAAFSADGKTLTTIEKEMGTRLWDVATGLELLPSDQHRKGLTGIACSPRSDRVATASWDGTVRLWHAKSGERLATLEDDMRVVYALTFLDDGKRLATGGSGPTVRIWEDGKVVARLIEHHGAVYALAATPDGKTLVSGGQDAAIRLWDLNTNKAVKIQPTAAMVRQLAVSSDGQVVASLDDDHQILLWFPATGKTTSFVSVDKSSLYGLALSPSGHLLYGMDGCLRVWDTASGRLLASVRATTGRLNLLNDRLLVCSNSETACVVDWPTGRKQPLPEFGSYSHGTAASMNPPRLYTAHNNALGFAWDLTDTVKALELAEPPTEKSSLAGIWKRLADNWYCSDLRQLLDNEMTPAFLAEKLTPIAGVSEKELATLLTQLDDDDFDKREKAATRLAEIGEAALPAMKKRLEAPAGADLKNHLLELIRKAEEISPERLRAIRAVLALEMIGTPAARELLGKLAKGDSSARLTRDAIAALKRLDKR